jgi:amino acid permease
MSNKPASNIKHKKNYYGVLTVALLSIGSTIGAGIYFKTSELLNNTGNIWLVYLA